MAICSSSVANGQRSVLAVLADGVGGLKDGEKASRLLVSTYEKQYKKNKDIDLQRFLAESNKQLHLKKTSGAMDIAAESTLIALSITDDRICWLNVGDSLLYRRRNKQLQKLNSAHTLGTEIDRKLRNNEISWEEAAALEDDRDILTSVISGTAINEIEFQSEEPELGARYIIASDGLQPLIDRHWENLLDAHENTPSPEMCNSLMQELMALNVPHQDNVSIIVIDITRSTGDSVTNSIFERFKQLFKF